MPSYHSPTSHCFTSSNHSPTTRPPLFAFVAVFIPFALSQHQLSLGHTTPPLIRTLLTRLKLSPPTGMTIPELFHNYTEISTLRSLLVTTAFPFLANRLAFLPLRSLLRTMLSSPHIASIATLPCQWPIRRVPRKLNLLRSPQTRSFNNTIKYKRASFFRLHLFFYRFSFRTCVCCLPSLQIFSSASLPHLADLIPLVQRPTVIHSRVSI